MKMPNYNWQQKAENTDFDPQGRVQTRVWARLSSRPQTAWKRPLAWGLCAACLLVLGMGLGVWVKQTPAPTAPTSEVLLQCKKAEPQQFMLSAELKCDGTYCSCTKTWTDCSCTNETCVHKKTCQLKIADFPRQMPWHLQDENSKIQSAGLAACQTQC